MVLQAYEFKSPPGVTLIKHVYVFQLLLKDKNLALEFTAPKYSKEEPFLSFFNQAGEVWWSRQVLSDGNSKEPKTVHLLYLSSIDVDRDLCLCLLYSKINNQLLEFTDVEQWIVLCTSCCKIVDFLHILTPIVVFNAANDGGAIRIPCNKVLLISCSAAVGVRCEKEGAEHTALGGSGVEH